MATAKISITLDKRRLKQKTGKYPITMLVSYRSESERYPTIFEANETEFDKLGQRTVPAALNALKESLKLVQIEAESIALAISPFSFIAFEKKYLLNNSCFVQRKLLKKLQNTIPANQEFDYKPFYKKFPILLEATPPIDTIAYSYQQYIKQKIRAGRIGTAASIHCGYQAFIRFGGNIRFAEITPQYLRDFENWLLNMEKGRSRTTVGMYATSMRTVMNEAIYQGIIKKDDNYPFGKRKYLIPKSRNVKKALRPSEITAIYQYEPETEPERKAKDFWFFMYNGNGMNPRDVATLKYKDIHGEFLTFTRTKTEFTTRHDPILITAYITEDMQRTINIWGNKDTSPDNYVFPILQQNFSPLRSYEVVQLFIAFVNKWMTKIVTSLGFDAKKGKTSVCRHSFATRMRNAGATNALVKDLLGHHNLGTTDNYLASFENDVIKEFALKLKENK